MLSKKSLAIASNLRDPKERLVEDKRILERTTRLEEKMKVECPFKPKINTKSQVIDTKKQSTQGKKRFEKLFDEVCH